MTAPDDARDARAQNALALLNEVRGAFSLAGLALEALGQSAVPELLEAEPLLLMMVGRASEAQKSGRVRDELRHAWNKALRRRGWKHLPALEGGNESTAVSAVAAPARPQSEDPAQLVAAFLSCFGVPSAPRALSPESLAMAHALCGVLLREIDALRALPLISPEEYAIRFHALVARWNELARRAPDLPALPEAASSVRS